MVGTVDYKWSDVEFYDGTNVFHWYIKVYDVSSSPWCYINSKKTRCYRVQSFKFDGYEAERA